jgi:hypothetical protein
LNLSELVRLVGDLAEVAVTILLAYVVFKIAMLVESLNTRLREGKSS